MAKTVEGSSAASALHGSSNRTLQCVDAAANATSHSPRFHRERCSGSAAAHPSAWRRAEQPRRVCSNVGGRARGRCLCVQQAWLPPQSIMPPQKHAYVHGLLMILSLSPVRIDSSLAGVEMCSCWALLDVGMGSNAIGCVVRVGARLVATCLVIPALACRENGLARIDLFQRGEQPR